METLDLHAKDHMVQLYHDRGAVAAKGAEQAWIGDLNHFPIQRDSENLQVWDVDWPAC